ncbi:MAG: hypothetical protein A2X19_01330 [Bacteroidetes bacterium GWE2_39_28]|nr:MAG: hypothetical protein A2X19_01330 [Bacteroidetes bacterium GWE2_39_28]OFY15769.1 MAG: hypothetical protein A2X16_01600 [Bacteroidetes bacterium GWF2_39_10]OFZ07647.1 MAG: hypothetical protein A2322_09225 [Bacteroidetes bacterium RIFOXYB2_FULL_39_7]OFZ09937.1 MAG: hypothetical protein A2465_06540 [Bacteroidetes bacterium RIFOXYC2_FULL_39_11]HCT93478.1 hypothetical protein [Rikenellaceae bacterium]
MKRRDFFKIVSLGGVSFALNPVIKASELSPLFNLQDGPETNIADAVKIPRTKDSMPGLYPGKVVKVTDPGSVVEGKPQEDAAYNMLKTAILSLTGEKSLKKAWRKFVSPKDIIGLKVNPVAGKLLTTSHAVTKSVIRQLEESGIPRKNIIIWDRREMQLHETGYTSENYPGIKITGTECMDEKGGFYNNEGKLYSEERIDKNQYFYADLEGTHDDYTIPYMVNGGKYSYFTKICTEQVTKIINIPILKNAGPTTTLALKNLAYGTITNTSRLHKIWHETCAFVCAFPPVRDKVVLNIADGLIGCFDGGPSAKPQFICNYNMLIVGTDPVAVDRTGHDVIIAKRIEKGIQTEDKKSASKFIDLAQDLKLGIGDRDKIELIEINS